MVEKFSQGIEKVLALAALDKEFREKLLTIRAAALKESEIELTESEQSILMSIPDEQLKNAIRRTRVPEPARRAFLKGATTAVVTALAVGVVGTCFFTATLSAGVRSPASSAYRILREIHFAQETWKEEKGRYGTLNDLFKANYLPSDYILSEDSEYRFEIYDVTETSWKARAIPKRKSGKTYYTNQSGGIVSSEDKLDNPETERQ